MRLATLDALEQERRKQGFRVAFKRAVNYEDGDWADDMVPEADEDACPTEAEALALLARLKDLHIKTRDYWLVHPNGSKKRPPSAKRAPVVASTGPTPSTVPPPSSIEPTGPPETPVSTDPPPDGQPLTVLAINGEWALVGDDRGLIYALAADTLRVRTEQGHPIRSSAKRVAMEQILGPQGPIPMLLAQHEGVSVQAAFAGSWYVRYVG